MTLPMREIFRNVSTFPRGVIVAKAYLENVFPTESPKLEAILEDRPHAECFLGDYTSGRFGWVLSEVVPFKIPIPFKGAQGLFEVADELIERQIK